MFDQEEINEWVTIDIVSTIVVFVLLGGYFIYKWADYKIFEHKIKKETENKKWP